MRTIPGKLIVQIFEIMVFFALFGCVPTRQSDLPASATVNTRPIFTLTWGEGERTPAEENIVIQTTPTQSPLPSSTQTFISTPTVFPTWTPAPTLSRQDARALVKDLLENNGGCRLPCWWGMVPGQTDWNTSRHFLETFVISIEQGEEGQIIKDGVPVYATNYSIRYEGEGGYKSGFLIGIVDGIISEVETGWDRNQKNYYLQRLLADYGQPDEVFIRAHRYTSTGDPPPFHILLNFKKNGFWVNYDMDGELVGNKIRGCPQSINPVLYLWSTDEDWTLEDMIQLAYGPPVPHAPEYPTLPLKEATGMDVETFTDIFKDPNNQSCIETPADLWF